MCRQRECLHPVTDTQFVDVAMPPILIESVKVLQMFAALTGVFDPVRLLETFTVFHREGKF